MVEREVLKKMIGEAVDKRKDEIIATLQQLVQIPSVTGQEAEAQRYMQKLYTDLGLKVAVFEPDIEKMMKYAGITQANVPQNAFTNRPDVIGTLEGSKSAKSLILNAHVDVVHPGPDSAWEGSPWSGRVEGSRLFGRGAGDDKSGLIANYFALKCLLDTGFKPEGTVILESVIGEEAGGAGTLAARLEGYNADGMVVTDAFGILVACSGTNSCTVRVKGKIAHAGYAEAGVNAIVKMTTIIQAIAELDEKRGRINYPLFLIGGKKKSCNLVIMSCQSAAKGFSVPGEADIYCSISTVPGEKSEDVRKQFEETVTSAAAKDDWLRENPPEIRWTPRPADPWEQDIKHPFVQLFKACIDETVGVDVPFTGMPSGFDAPIAARFGIPVLGTGGGGSNGHSPNEWVNLAGVFYLAKALALFIAEWCGVKSS